jgi:hypothetical protein
LVGEDFSEEELFLIEIFRLGERADKELIVRRGLIVIRRSFLFLGLFLKGLSFGVKAGD